MRKISSESPTRNDLRSIKHGQVFTQHERRVGEKEEGERSERGEQEREGEKERERGKERSFLVQKHF